MSIRLQVIESERQDGPVREFEGPVVTIGREAANDVVLTGSVAAAVSRRHAELRLREGQWQIVDRGSTHGTFLRGVQVCEARLSDGDEIQLAEDGPRLRVWPGQADVTRTRAVAARTSEQQRQQGAVAPWQMGLEPLAARGYLRPGLLAAGTLSAVMWSASSGQLRLALLLMIGFFAAGSTGVLYQLAGKPKRAWVMIGAALGVGMFVHTAHAALAGPLQAVALEYFGEPLAGPTPRLFGPPSGLLGKLGFHFLAAALPEELEKILPALVGLYVARRSSTPSVASPLHAEVAVREPLDGILLGVAGAAGFNIVEALLYVGHDLDQLAQLQQHAGEALTALVKREGAAHAPVLLVQAGFNQGIAILSQVFLRGLGSVFGHCAYSGIFGYYVGLAAMRRSEATSLLVRGALTAMSLHTLWNATDVVGIKLLLPAVSFLLLISCIVKARSLSPERATNFATVVGRQLG